MKKITLLAFLAVFVLAATSCTKDDEEKKDNQETPSSEYYVTYKANGTQVTQTEVAGSRGTVNGTNTLIITGSGKDGASPKFKFLTTETFVGFSAGLNIGSTRNSADKHYVEFTNSAGLLHTTALSDDGTSTGFFKLEYKKDGIAEGTFGGKVQAQNGSVVTITDGEFRVKFSN